MGYSILERMVKLSITVLHVVNGDSVESYPLQMLLDALKDAGYNKTNCAQLLLTGLDGDAVIIDTEGNKVAL